MVNNLLLVGLGGAAGSILRYSIQRIANTPAFPYGTFLINLGGCLLIGMFWGLITRNTMTQGTGLLLMSGFCGGFTTFSAFALENVKLLQNGEISAFLMYTFLSIGLGLLAVLGGINLLKLF